MSVSGVADAGVPTSISSCPPTTDVRPAGSHRPRFRLPRTRHRGPAPRDRASWLGRPRRWRRTAVRHVRREWWRVAACCSGIPASAEQPEIAGCRAHGWMPLYSSGYRRLPRAHGTLGQQPRMVASRPGVAAICPGWQKGSRRMATGQSRPVALGVTMLDPALPFTSLAPHPTARQ